MKSKWTVMALISILPVLGVLIFLVKPIKVLPIVAEAPAYSLTDQDGNVVNDGDLQGKIVLYDFVYTSCQTVCPAMTGEMLQISRELNAKGWLDDDVMLVTITFDPERDTTQRLKTYAGEMNADQDGWRWLTGESLTIKRVVGGQFGVFFEQVDPEATGHDGHNSNPDIEAYDFIHETVFVLVDEDSMIRAQYEDFDAVKWAVRDIGLLVREKNSGPVARLAFQAAHRLRAYPAY